MLSYKDPLFAQLRGPMVNLSEMRLEIQPLGPAWEGEQGAAVVLKPEPHVDLTAESLRQPLPARRFFSSIYIKETPISIAFHLAFLVVVLLLSRASWVDDKFLKQDQTPVVMTFGLVKKEVSAKLNPSKIFNQPLPEATKTEQLLPQLPKNLAVDVPEGVELKKDSIANPDSVKVTQEPVYSGQKSKDDHAQKIKPDDYLKRLERQSRVVGEKEQNGQHAPSPSLVPANPLANEPLPQSPFASQVPDAPPGLGPVGEVTGQGLSDSQVDAYRASVLRHMRQHWKLEVGRHYAASLKVRVSFEVNALGRIVGLVKVLRSSGSVDFDDDALDAVKNAAPFPDLPKGFGRTKLVLDLQPASADVGL